MIPKGRRDKEHRKFYDHVVPDASLKGAEDPVEYINPPPTNMERYEQRGWISNPHIPESPLQALMETAPGDEPVVSRQEMRQFKELLADAIESLPEVEREAWELYYIGGLSLKQIEREHLIPASTVRDRAYRGMDRLQRSLLEHDSVRRYLGINDEQL